MAETKLINPLHPSVVDRMDPRFAEIYNKYQAPKLRADQVTYEEYNADRSKFSLGMPPGTSPEVGSTKIHKVPVTDPPGEIQVQVYHPTSDAITKNGFATKDGKLPAHVNYHGGGFVIGDLKTDESWCRQACQALGCIIVNVDYRLAPEFPHPIPLTDSWAALKWTFASAAALGIDKWRVSIGGLSAGGQLSAVLALLARDEPGMEKLVLQMLIVPTVDSRWVPIENVSLKGVEGMPYSSYVENEEAPCLPMHRLIWFCNLWLGTDPEERKKKVEHFYASPIIAESHANLAPASIHVAGVDTFTSEGIAYHHVLTKAGTPSMLKVYEGQAHSFGHWDGELEKAREFVRDSIATLRKAYTI